MNSTDIFIQNYFSLVRTSFVTECMYLVSKLFDVSWPYILLVLLVCVLIYTVRNIDYIFLFLLSLLFSTVVTYILKLFFHVARPLGGAIVETGNSFPSYHATIATVFFIMLMYIFDPVVDFGIVRSKRTGETDAKIHYWVDDYLPSFLRILFNAMSVIFILLISFSRIYLGVHWLSDVLGGVLLGCIISYISIIIFRYRKNMRHPMAVLE